MFGLAHRQPVLVVELRQLGVEPGFFLQRQRAVLEPIRDGLPPDLVDLGVDFPLLLNGFLFGNPAG